jgi:hypothetical protein
MALVARFPGRKRSVELNALPVRELVERFEAGNAEIELRNAARTPAEVLELMPGTLKLATVDEFLTALVREEVALGSVGHITRVAVQQDRASEPMDDVVADSAMNGESYRLSLQVKSSLTISAADKDFGKVIKEALATRANEGFDPARHRYGFVVRTVANATLNSFKRILESARASTTGAEFVGRFVVGGEMSKAVIDLRNELRPLLGKPSMQAKVFSRATRYASRAAWVRVMNNIAA